MRKHHKECRSLCESNGLKVLRLEHRSKHLAVICEEGMIMFACTPSDHRWRHKAASHIRRMARSH